MSFDSELTQFSQLFRKHLNDNQQAQIRWVTASEVDATSYTMTAVGLTDGLEYYNIMLGSDKMSVIPAVGSLCLIGLVEGEEAHTFLIHAETPDQVIINAKTDLTIAGAGGNLGNQLSDLIDEICKIYVIQGTSPNVTTLQGIQANIKKILKNKAKS
ncbi:MAG: hypothetical protein P4L28_00030 [Paludibacteraceae bacterium]|nr:hypothetical protein [Paludibacteraceae bacterium]